MNYKQLTLRQRYHIQAYWRAGFSKTDIAKELGVDKSTITREFQRNMSKKGYRPDFANRRAIERRSGKAKRRITEETWSEVETELVLKQWSPEQISGRRKRKGKQTVSPEWIYQRIYRNELDTTLSKHLRCKKKRRKRKGTYDKRGCLKNTVSIEKRPAIVDERARIGDWEVDTIIGKIGCQAIVSMTERKTKLLRIGKIEKKTGKLTKQAITNKLAGLIVQTITSDNGKEFSEHEQIAKKLDSEFYFCHPYASWERGLNENTNGLIRQYFPKNTSLKTVTQRDIQIVEDKLNNRPRKTLGYKTPNEVYSKELEKLNTVALTT